MRAVINQLFALISITIQALYDLVHGCSVWASIFRDSSDRHAVKETLKHEQEIKQLCTAHEIQRDEYDKIANEYESKRKARQPKLTLD